MRRSTADDVLKEHCLCYEAFANIVEFIQYAARLPRDTAVLNRNVCSFLSSYQRLYGRENMIYKVHMLHHFGDFLNRVGAVPNAWALERKHKQTKVFADVSTRVGKGWDNGVLREVTIKHINNLEKGGRTCFGEETGLIAPKHVCTQDARRLAEQMPGATHFSTSKDGWHA